MWRHAVAYLLALAAAIWTPAGAVAADTAFGQYLSSECVTCHQLTGRYDGIPPIVGWPEQTFIAIMEDYRQKRRDNQAMQTIAARLSDQEIAALAAYFANVTAEKRR
jgi:cytochrome c553